MQNGRGNLVNPVSEIHFAGLKFLSGPEWLGNKDSGLNIRAQFQYKYHFSMYGDTHDKER